MPAKYDEDREPPYPADTIVEVTSLAAPEIEIEIEAIALADGEIVG